MGSERRRHTRFKQPFEGTWRGASGASPCRIGDISIGGCFVHSLAMPGLGESTVVTVSHGDGLSLAIPGDVMYVEPSMGFAVRFKEPLPPETVRDLHALIDSLGKPKPAT